MAVGIKHLLSVVINIVISHQCSNDIDMFLCIIIQRLWGQKNDGLFSDKLQLINTNCGNTAQRELITVISSYYACNLVGAHTKTASPVQLRTRYHMKGFQLPSFWPRYLYPLCWHSIHIHTVLCSHTERCINIKRLWFSNSYRLSRGLTVSTLTE